MCLCVAPVLLALAGCRGASTTVSIVHTNAMPAYTYELRLENRSDGVAVATIAGHTESVIFDKPAPLGEDLWQLAGRAKVEAGTLVESPADDFSDPFGEAIIVTAIRGSEVMQFSVFNRRLALGDGTVIAPNLRRLLEFASSGRAKAHRIIEPLIGPGSGVQRSP
jgi:hypothetical protein